MIVVLVSRLEEVEVFGLYLDADLDAVEALVHGLAEGHPTWGFKICHWHKPIEGLSQPVKLRWRRASRQL